MAKFKGFEKTDMMRDGGHKVSVSST